MEMSNCATTLDPIQHPLLDSYGRDLEYNIASSSIECNSISLEKSAESRSMESKPSNHNINSETSKFSKIYLLQSYPDFTNHNFNSETSKFSNIYLLQSFPDFMDLLSKLRHHSQAIDAITNGTAGAGAMQSANRNWVIHKILSIPPSSTIMNQSLPSKELEISLPLYEVCRLTCLIYGIHVVFPTPRSRAPRAKLVPLLREALQKIKIVSQDRSLQEFVLWCVVIGGIAAASGPERVWYVREMNILAVRLGMECWEWSQVKSVLKGFAWVDFACDLGGETLWGERLLMEH